LESWVFRSRKRDPACRAGVPADNWRSHAYQASAAAGGSVQVPLIITLGTESTLQAAFTSPPPILFLGGEIDESSYLDLRGVLEFTAASRHHQLQVDMASVEYCDLAGLRAIISLTQLDELGSARVDQLVLRQIPTELGVVIRILGWDATPGLFLAEPAC
jgi:anti-anti-sigma regulatory factor